MTRTGPVDGATCSRRDARARDGITADSLATAVSVLGPINGIKLIEATPGAAVHLVRRPDVKIETYESSAFKKFCERP